MDGTGFLLRIVWLEHPYPTEGILFVSPENE